MTRRATRTRVCFTLLFRLTHGAAAVLALVTLLPAKADAQTCSETTLATGLRIPLGITQTPLGNLMVSESGTLVPHSGRISIVDGAGGRRSLLDGLPSGPNDIGEPSGPAGIAMQGRTLYVLIGTGDAVLPGPIPTSHLPNPNVSSPLFSSVLAIHFSAAVEQKTAGFVLSPADQQALAGGESVILSNGGGDTISIELVTNFADYVARTDIPTLVRASNPFGVVVVGNLLYVTDGSRNLVWSVDIRSGSQAVVAEFPPVPNPLFGAPGLPGGPTLEAVPTGISYAGGTLLVTLLRGLPFPPNTSTVLQVDPATGEQSALVSGLKTAIAVTEVRERGDVDYLVLQHSSGPGPFFGGPGLVLRVEAAGATPSLIANCLTRPSSMVFDEKVGLLYIVEVGGRLVALPIE